MDGQQPADPQASEPQVFKPGETITPAASASEQASASAAPDTSAPRAEATAQAPMPEQPVAETPELTRSTAASPNATEFVSPAPGEPKKSDSTIVWTASEFIAHDKPAGWYGGLALSAALLAAIIYLLTRDKISTGAVIVVALSLAFYATRKPQQLRYMLNEQGVGVGERFYSYNEFRSFSLMQEGAFSSISFIPLRRLGPMITIYFDPNDEKAIMELLNAHVPFEQREHDMIDKFLKRIHL